MSKITFKSIPTCHDINHYSANWLDNTLEVIIGFRYFAIIYY